jgi:predicted nucleic acid-binding protein
VEVYGLDRRIARRAAQIRATLALSLADAAIVATALHAGCDVIVGNDERCARRVAEIPYVFLDDVVKGDLT